MDTSAPKATSVLSRSFVGVKLLLLAVIGLGIFFRGANLDGKMFWGDETSTLSRISGYYFSEIRDRFSNYSIPASELEQYQQFAPNRGIPDVVDGLAVEEPQLPPAYFLSLRLWVKLFGNSVAAVRGFSALSGILSIAAMFWLSQELLPMPLMAWAATALFAVSPFQVLYAQEARPQSLWALTLLLASAALLRALRRNRTQSWILYGLALTLSFYTYMLSGVLAIAHGIYVLVQERFRPTPRLLAYMGTSIISTLLFLPWLLRAFGSFAQLDSATAWTQQSVGLGVLLKTWALNLSRGFGDLNYSFVQRDLLGYAGILAIAALVAAALFLLVKTAEPKVWLFVLLLMGIICLPLAGPDLLFGGRRSTVIRYFIPAFIGLDLMVAYSLIAQGFSSKKPMQRGFWRGVGAILLMAGVLSCGVSAQADTWWNKYNGVDLPAVANVVNAAADPVLILDGQPPLEFSYLLAPTVMLQSVEASVPGDSAFVFSRNYSEDIRDSFLQQHPEFRVAEEQVWKQKVDPAYEYKLVLWTMAR
ncbi:MAG: glycosyltransferase family 39 protein [Cyanobacteria bacterium P01_D01_bin.128]